MSRRRDAWVGWALALATAMQGILLVPVAHLRGALAVQVVLVAAAVGATVRLAWRVRAQLDHHVDMALVMLAFGGLGMIVGWWIDMGLGLHPYPSVWSAVFSLMTGLMLAAAVPPAFMLTRCAELARRSRVRWVVTHVVGNLAMVAGMIAGGRGFGAALGGLIGSRLVGGHLAMVIGMVVGMEAGMIVGEALAGFRPWVRERVPLPRALR